MTDEVVSSRRDMGATWERNFCLLAGQRGKEFTPHQLVRKDGAAVSYWLGSEGKWQKQLLPDVVIWSDGGEHHEVKHKNRMSFDRFGRCYGYEEYRLRELIRFANRTGQRVYYTIHDWEIAGAGSSSDEMPNRIEDWFCADVATLSRSHTGEFTGKSIIGGQMKYNVRQFFWSARKYFRPLAEVWQENDVRIRRIGALPSATVSSSPTRPRGAGATVPGNLVIEP